jgi:LIVCS family branched-chain amino acid:cation transporter
MNRIKETFVLGFAIFASFFGAGNLILPPMIGFNAGPDWWLVSIGFLSSTTVIPLLALLGFARLQGSIMDFSQKVSSKFSLIFSIGIYGIAVILACPRTAAVTHEMAVQPYFETDSLLTSSIYFSLVFVFVINRGKVMEVLGKYLSPIIGIIILTIIGIGLFAPSEMMLEGKYNSPYINGFLEGYQTYDALAGLILGGVMVITVKNSKNYVTDHDKKRMIARSSFIAMMGLLIIYVGMIFLGAKYNAVFDASMSRPQLLSGLANETLGSLGNAFLSVLVALACFTTAVSIIVGTADFFKDLFNNSKKAYVITAAISVIIGIIMGQFEVKFIIDLAVYVLMFLYPMAIALIFLNLFPEKYGSQAVFRIVVGIAFVFSIPDFLKFLIPPENLEFIYNTIPFSREGMGWVLPSIIGFLTVNAVKWKQDNKAKES